MQKKVNEMHKNMSRRTGRKGVFGKPRLRCELKTVHVP